MADQQRFPVNPKHLLEALDTVIWDAEVAGKAGDEKPAADEDGDS